MRTHRAGATRRLDLAEFLVGSYEVTLQPDELLTAVLVRPLDRGWTTSFQRVERFYRPTLNIAAAVRADAGRIAEARLAIGCVGPRPLRVPELEVRVAGLTATEADAVLREHAPAHLAEILEPVDDLLGSAAYKVHIATGVVHAPHGTCPLSAPSYIA
jgi:carbon-monoxide dehydrogenase medium subunit